MNKKDIQAQFTVERNDASEVFAITIHGWDESLPIEHVAVDKNAVSNKAAVYAAMDLLRHGDYTHPLTQVGFHMKVSRGDKANKFIQKNIGAVMVGAVIPDGITLPYPTIEEYPDGWAQINRVNKLYVIGQPEDSVAFSRKHNYVDGIMQGYTFRVFIPAYLARPAAEDSQAWIEAMLENWLETNDTKALQMRNDRINSMFDRQKMYAPIARAKTNGGLTAEDFNGTNAETPITMVDNTVVPLGELPMVRYKAYNGNRVVRSILWDGSLDAKALISQVVKYQWKLKKI